MFAFEYYAYWNGEQIRDLFEIIVAITSGPDFIGLLKSVALAGFLCVLTMCAIRYRGLDAVSFMGALIIFYMALLVPKVDMTIRDDRAQSVHVIQNVPLGVGFIASTTSIVGHWLTETFESTFADVDAARLSKFGVAFPERAVTEMASVRPITPEGRRLIDEFNRQCVVPELVDHMGKRNALTTSTDLWATIKADGWVNPARRMLNTDNTWVSCTEGITVIDNYLTTTEVAAIQTHLGMKLLPDRVDPSAEVATVIPQSEALLLNVSRSLADSIKHSVFLNTIPQSVESVAHMADNPLSVATALAHAQGNLASEINYRTMSKIAQEALPKVRNSLEFIVIACFPLLFIMVLGAGHMAGMILRSYFTLFIWLQLWAPISSVINYLIIHVDANPLNRLMAEYGGNTLMAVDLIREYGASSQAIAGYLMILAPVISFAIAKGSDIATSQMVGSIMAPAQSAAQSQGAALAAGNVTMGNASWGNVSSNTWRSNKNDTSISWTSPAMTTTTTPYGSVTRTESGAVTGMTQTRIDMGIQSSASIGNSGTVSNQSNLSAGFAHSNTQSLNISNMASSSDRGSAGFATALSNSVSQNTAVSHSATENTSSSRMLGWETEGGQTRRQSASEGANITSGATGGLNTNSIKTDAMTSPLGGLGGPAPSSKLNGAPPNATRTTSLTNNFGTGATTGVQVNHAQQLIDTATSGQEASDSMSRQQAYQTLVNASREIAASTNDQSIRDAAQRFETDLTKAFQHAQNQALTQTSAKQASQSIGAVSMQDIRTQMDNNPYAMHKAIERFGSAEAAQEAFFHSPIARQGFMRELQSGSHEVVTITTPKPQSIESVDREGQNHANATAIGMAGVVAVEGARAQSTLGERTAETAGREPHVVPNSEEVTGQYQQETTRQTHVSNDLTNEMLLERGAQRVANMQYHEGQYGMRSLALTALLGGMTYKSPAEYQDALIQKSQDNPALRNTLIGFGTSSEPISAKDFNHAYRANEEVQNEIKNLPNNINHE